MQIRKMVRADLPAIDEIYNQAIKTYRSTADMEPLSESERNNWFEHHIPDKYPVLVMEVDSDVAGWLSVSPYRPGRMALRYTAEISYYVHEKFHRMGIASALLQYVIDHANEYGIRNIFAIVLDKNEASIKLLEKFNFDIWARMPDVADFDGEVCGHVYYGRKV